MKRFDYIPALACIALTVTVSACGLFGKYSSRTTAPQNLFGSEDFLSGADTSCNFAARSWRELFKDTLLQELIDSALARNVELSSARLRVGEAKAVLKSAKLGYLPTISFSPSFTAVPGMSYSIPLGANWGVDGFGSITNRLRETKALSAQAEDNLQAVQSQLIASVASLYFHLQVLDRQYEIMTSTEKNWERLLEIQKSLMENGKAYSTSVSQMKASLLGVQLKKFDVEETICEVECSLNLILGKTPGHIERSAWTVFRVPDGVSIGIPAQILENRPDVRAAGRNVEAAFYVTNQARAAMFPSISISGLIGWGSDGIQIPDPGHLIYRAVASLAQPIFNQGKLAANLKVSKLRQQEAAEQYTQTILNAGNEVHRALHDCMFSEKKDKVYKQEVAALTDAYNATEELMKSGKAMYLEVLMAQNSLLEAQLGEALNLYNGVTSLIDLYAALGGGVK